MTSSGSGELPHTANRTGLILGGGGARASYQVGALKALAELIPPDRKAPFPIICGASAGAINATVLAAYTRDFHEGVRRLVGVWENFATDKVFRTSASTTSARLIRWGSALVFGGGNPLNPVSVLDNRPLRNLIERHIPFDRVQQALDQGLLRALCVTACSYTSGHSVSFFQAQEAVRPWARARRVGCRHRITIDHLMASTAIPLIFPAVDLRGEFFGDGSMRQTAPISPAIHLGARKVLILGVRREYGVSLDTESGPSPYPGLGQIAGYVLDTLFLNSLRADLERLQRINQTLSLLPRADRSHTHLRPIKTLLISPSQDIAEIALRHQNALPRSVKYLLYLLGARRGSGRRLMSYLLFEQPFCRALIELGYRDALAQKDEIVGFLNDAD
ncbi:MAG: patatin-like phospholipase family protein, partial [Gammaproteobacteria bacterium]|nr:patatin-like phospholipase family protein [Gammaproteobacteria bacterium]